VLVWKRHLFCDLEDFDLLHAEMLRACENRVLLQSDVIAVNDPKRSETSGASIALIGNINVTKVWTQSGITPDCPPLHFGLQPKSPRRDVVRILQREKETPQTGIGFVAAVLLP
jgi:hypothetical protein